jgi:hypothetical protein
MLLNRCVWNLQEPPNDEKPTALEITFSYLR